MQLQLRSRRELCRPSLQSFLKTAVQSSQRLTLSQYQEEGRNAVVMAAHARSTAIWLDWRVPFPVTCLLTPSKRSADEFEKPRWTARVRLLGIAPTEYRADRSTTKYTYITTTTTIPPHHVRTLRGTGLQQTGLLGQASRSHLRGGSCKASQLCARSSSLSYNTYTVILHTDAAASFTQAKQGDGQTVTAEEEREGRRGRVSGVGLG